MLCRKMQFVCLVWFYKTSQMFVFNDLRHFWMVILGHMCMHWNIHFVLILITKFWPVEYKFDKTIQILKKIVFYHIATLFVAIVFNLLRLIKKWIAKAKEISYQSLVYREFNYYHQSQSTRESISLYYSRSVTHLYCTWHLCTYQLSWRPLLC